MKLNIQLNNENNPIINIQITSPNDPLILYLLELTEIEYTKIMKEQKILINFNEFPNFLLNLGKLCTGEQDQNHTAILNLNDLPEVIFSIEEKIKFKITDLIILKLRNANDEEIKKYLSKVNIDLKNKNKDLLYKLNETNIKNENLTKEIISLKGYISKNEYENKSNLDNLINDKDNEINLIKENYLKQLKQQKELFENEKKNIMNKYKDKIFDLENKIINLTKIKEELEEKNYKFQMNDQKYEGKYDISNNELIEKIKENQIIQSDKKSIEEKYIKLEKEFNELKCKNNNLEIENEETKKNNFDLNIIINSLKKQLESNEDNIKSLKASNINLQLKLDKSLEEIKKGNIIIETLNNEIKNKKLKLKSVKQTVDMQEALIKEKQNMIDSKTKDLDDIKRDTELKDKEIIELKNINDNYIIKLNENKQLLEENKQMILYLNNNINENKNAPFKSRYKQNYYINKKPEIDLSTNIYNLDDFNENINNDNIFNNNIDNNIMDNDINLKKVEKFGDNQSRTLYQDINYYYDKYNILNNDDNEGEDEMIILPETNLCNYHVSGKLGRRMNKYRNEDGNYQNNYNVNNNNKNSILEHKYGNIISNNDNKNDDYVKRNTYNIEEEFKFK